MKYKICILGSGNFGSAIARIIGKNAASKDMFEQDVTMWVYEEEINGRKLTEIINTEHENVKYLPGYKIPENVRAEPDLRKAVKGADLLVFVLPHQFLPRLFADIRAGLADGGVTDMSKVLGISLIKGIDFDENGLVLISDTIRKGLPGMDVSVLMGANVATGLANEEFCEATIGYSIEENGLLWKEVFDIDYYKIQLSQDFKTVELCGALKNVVALGAGFCDGLGYGGNSKAAIIRLGLLEMMDFCKTFFGEAPCSAGGEGCGMSALLNTPKEEDGQAKAGTVQISTFFESCAVADLITTCYGGRNRKCAEAFVRTGKDWDEIEAELLGGQKLQGTLTAVHVYEILENAGILHRFPLFNVIYKIMTKEVPPSELVRMYVHVPS